MWKKITIFSLIYILLVSILYQSNTISAKTKYKHHTSMITHPSYVILGYYVKYSSTDFQSYQSLNNFGSSFNSVSMASYTINSTGDVSLSDSNPTEGIQLAKSQGKTSYALFSNQDFNSDSAHKLLSSDTLRTKAINNITWLTKKNFYKGVNLDFEGISPSDRSNYNLFVRKLSTILHTSHLKLVVSVPAKTTDCSTCDWEGAFDYKTIGKAADYVQVMTYDENGPWSDNGPIAPFSWVDKTLSYSVKVIPSKKVLMGLPAYAYDWDLTDPKLNTSHPGKNYWYGSYQWDNNSKSPYFVYKDSLNHQHIVWFENKKSIQLKTNLVKKYRLGGVSMWRLGQENKDFWSAVTTSLK